MKTLKLNQIIGCAGGLCTCTCYGDIYENHNQLLGVIEIMLPNKQICANVCHNHYDTANSHCEEGPDLAAGSAMIYYRYR